MDDAKPQNVGGDQSAESGFGAADQKLSRAIELNGQIERRNAAAQGRLDQIDERIRGVQAQLGKASASRIESSNLSLAKLFKGMEKRIVQLEGMLTWVWIFSVATLLAVVVMSSFTYWQLAKEANFTHRLLVDEREE